MRSKKIMLLWFLQPLLIALFPALHMCAHSAHQISWLHLSFVILLITTGTSLLFFLSSLIYRSFSKGALVTNILIILFYSTKPVADSLFVPLSQAFLFFRLRYILIFLALVTLFFLYKMLKITFISPFFLKILIIPFLFLNLFAIYSFATKKIEFAGLQRRYDATNETFIKDLMSQVSNKKNSLPDIYFIILDAYTNNDSLKIFFDHANHPFTKKLEQIGFYIAKQSKSNYPQTYPSLAGTFNARYLPKDILKTPYYYVVTNNVTKTVLKKLGYKIFDLALETSDALSLFYDEDYFAMQQKQQSLSGEFKRFLLGQNYFTKSFLELMTPIYPLVTKLYDTVRRETFMKKLNLLEKIAAIEKTPKFVYVHIYAPHHPYSFDEHGDIYPPQEKTQSKSEWQKKGYINTVKFINKKIYPILEKILEKSLVSPVVILQGDHGSHFPQNLFPMLNAWHLPENGRKSLYPTISPVNNFRVICNQYFGTKLPLLKDKSIS